MPEHRMPPEDEFQDEGYIAEVLAGDDRELQEKFRNAKGLSLEELHWVRYYARLRRDTLRNMQNERNKHPKMPSIYKVGLTPETLQLYIEPQVRYAVETLAAKGYTMKSSGFSGFGEKQHIRFDGVAPEIPVALIEEFALEGIMVVANPREEYLSFYSKGQLTMEQLKSAWNRIASAIPPQAKERS